MNPSERIGLKTALLLLGATSLLGAVGCTRESPPDDTPRLAATTPAPGMPDSPPDPAGAAAAQTEPKSDRVAEGAAEASEAGQVAARDAKEATEEAARRILDATRGAAEKIKEAGREAVETVREVTSSDEEKE